MSSKLSRREAIKVIAAAGAVLIGAPYFAKSVAAAGLSGVREAQPVQRLPSEGTLFVRVKGDEVTGFMGLQELKIADSGLASRLNGIFQGNRELA